MHAIVLALAASLALGPAAPAPTGDVEAPGEAADSQPAMDAEAEAEVAPAEAEPAPDLPSEAVEAPEPAPPSSDPQALAASTAEPNIANMAVAAPVVPDRLGCDQSKRCRRMTITGIVVGSLGIIGVGTGIGLLVNKDEVIPESPVFVTSTRPAGLVMLTVSSGVTFTAVLMLVAAHKGYKDRPDDQARIQITPTGLRF